MRLDPKAFRRYRPTALLELSRLWLILLYVDARLKVWPQSWNRAWLFGGRKENGTKPGPRTLRKLNGIATLLRTAARFRLRTGTPCLCLSLALRTRSVPLGLHPSLVYGARKRRAASGGIDAHAWLKFGSIGIDPLGSSEIFSEFSGPTTGADASGRGRRRGRDVGPAPKTTRHNPTDESAVTLRLEEATEGYN